MKLAKPLSTTLGALALTVVAAGSALAVNIGIMSQIGDASAATIEALPATPVVSQVSPQYVYVDLSDVTPVPDAASQVADQVTQPAVLSTATARSFEYEDGYEYEGAEYDD